MQDQGGMRMDEVLIAVETFVFRLRIGVALLEEHNRTVLASPATEYVLDLLVEMLGGAEDGAEAVRQGSLRVEAEAGVGPEDGVGHGSR